MADNSEIFKTALSNLAVQLAQTQANLALSQAELKALKGEQTEVTE